jgi:sulfite reductase alpha subunit-like flavoprotein
MISRFNWAHKKLSNRLLQLGAQIICDRAESDEQHPEGIDGSFVPWLAQLRQRLLEHYPLPGGLEAIPENVLLEPKWILQHALGGEKLLSNGTSNRPPDGLLTWLPRGATATITMNDRVTPATHWQDVRHLSLQLDEQHAYSPGDTLTIYPKNFPADVDQFLNICGWTSVADQALIFVPTDRDQHDEDIGSYPSPPIPRLSSDHLTLRKLLTLHLDIMSIPRRSFFSHLSHYTDDEFHTERLKEFTNPEFLDELFDYTTRPRRSILEVLDEFTSVKLPWQKICSIIPVLRGRQFSIASGGALKVHRSPDPGRDQKTKVELLIAIVKYRTVIKRIREGVCTRYIATLRPGQRITVTLQKGGLHPKQAEIEKPVIMIGPGTGVAPMRSLTYERIKTRLEHGISVNEGCEDILLFGCRNEHSDYFFKEEWQALAEQGALRTFVAFSRDQVGAIQLIPF